MTWTSGAAMVAGVVGAPVRQSLSPLLHTRWIEAAGLDAAYVPFCPAPDRFDAFVEGLRGGAVRGVNVTLPFKQAALAMADDRDVAAEAAGAANLLLFHVDGRIEARNTDGLGLLAAFAEQAPDWRPDSGPVLVLGAGGAARGAVAALLAAGARVRLANRTRARAEALAEAFPALEVVDLADLRGALRDAAAVVNATAGGLEGAVALEVPLEAAPATAVVMDMVYKPLRTPLLRQAAACGLTTVDGLSMLIGQAVPSFQAFFDQAPPAVDVRCAALAAIGETG